MHHVRSIVLIEKLAMGDHLAGIINEGDQKRLSPGAIRLLDSRPYIVSACHNSLANRMEGVPQLFLLIPG